MNNKISGLRLILLYLIAISFVIINISDVKISGFSSIAPLFSLMIIFYFSVLKKVFNIWFIFILGVWTDALGGQHLGITPLTYIFLIKIFLLFNGKAFVAENFRQIWQQFIIFCFAFLFIKYLFVSAFVGSFLSIYALLMQFIISSLSYVLMHRFFDYLNKKLLEN